MFCRVGFRHGTLVVVVSDSSTLFFFLFSFSLSLSHIVFLSFSFWSSFHSVVLVPALLVFVLCPPVPLRLSVDVSLPFRVCVFVWGLCLFLLRRLLVLRIVSAVGVR